MPLDLFSEFAPTSKNDWLAKIEKDLKGHPISDLIWHLDDLSIDPFASFEDFNNRLPEPITGIQNNNDWEIGEDIILKNNDFKSANQAALNALMGGITAPSFILDNYIDESHLSQLLEGIELDYISTYFFEKTQNTSPLNFLKIFKNTVLNMHKNPLQLRGGIAYNSFADGQFDVKSTLETLTWAKENLPQFKIVNVNATRFFKGSAGVVEELTNALKAGETYLNELTNSSLNIEDISSRMTFTFQIGLSYFVEIAKLRAFKLLWGNVLKAYNATPSVANIHAIVNPDVRTEDANTNKIMATTQAMSAVIGGVNKLTIGASDMNLSEKNASNTRIARNIQHILKMESYLDKVIDPSAGSYYIEKLTEQIAEKVWEKFVKI